MKTLVKSIITLILGKLVVTEREDCQRMLPCQPTLFTEIKIISERLTAQFE